MNKHTPGPWKIAPSWDDCTVEGPNGEEIIFQDGPYQTPTIKIENARLIAAAPELLEALRVILNISLMDTSPWAKTVAIEARAAIAKTGEQA
mgnify:CR=1 FL=1